MSNIDQNEQRPINFAVHQRMRLIDLLLEQYGYVGRQAVADYFGISDVQASIDLRSYSQLAPGNASYDAAIKAHVRSANFSRRFP